VHFQQDPLNTDVAFTQFYGFSPLVLRSAAGLTTKKRKNNDYVGKVFSLQSGILYSRSLSI
jgi:hypothetical protein